MLVAEAVYPDRCSHAAVTSHAKAYLVAAVDIQGSAPQMCTHILNVLAAIAIEQNTHTAPTP
jgi:hypothetical protein